MVKPRLVALAGAPAPPAALAANATLLERDPALRDFEARLARLRAGEPEVGACVLVHGEAGVGKTALVQAARLRAGDAIEWLRGACEPLLSAPPLGPLIDLLDRLPPSLSEAVRSGHRIQDVLAGVLAMLRERATPVVLVIDDVQWADSATLDLLRYVGRRIESTRALLVLIYRDDALGAEHPLRSVLGGLPTRSTLRIELRPLSRAGVAELARRAGRPARGLHRASQGNPFFVTELLAGDGERLPASVRDAVLARAVPLSAVARDVLERVSVAPTQLERELLVDLHDDATAALKECGDAGLLLDDGLVVRFRHELARQSVEASMVPVRARALHAEMYQALTARAASAARRVHHAERAGLRDVFEVAVQAAREAAAAAAHRQAAALYGLALAHAGALAAPERAALAEARADECTLVNLIDEAIASRMQALALRRELGDVRGVGINLRVLARLEFFRAGPAAALAHAEAAVAALEPLGPDRELALACATMAQVRVLDETPAPSLAWAARALQLGESLGDVEVLVYALNTVGCAGLRTHDEAHHWAQLRRSLALSLAHGIEEHAARGYTNIPSLALAHRRFDEVLSVCAEGIAYCEARDFDMYAARLRIRRAYAYLELGRWSEVLPEIALARQLPAMTPVEQEQARNVEMLLALRRGDASETVRDYWDGLISGTRRLRFEQWYSSLWAARAEGAWLRGDAAALARIAVPALATALRTDDPWRTGQLACWLRRIGHLPAGFSGRVAPPCQAELDGDPRAAAAAWGALGCRHDQALALLQGDEADVREALKVFQSLGAEPGTRIARRRLRALGVQSVERGPHPRTRVDPQGLTARQREVLQLLVQRLSNTEIALRLHRSERTVEHHVSALLAKLGVASRAEAINAAEAVPPQAP